MSSPDHTAAAATLFAGPGEMRALCRDLDWSSTPLGPVEGWSHSLRTTAATLLASRHPMFLWWGPNLIQIYNDAYRPSFGGGGRHPRALGMRGRDFWTDIWEIIGPQIDGVMTRGEATWHEDQLVPIERNGRLEEVWWTYGYSPVLDDDGRIGGTLVVCQETTSRMLADRRLKELNHALEVERSRLADVFRQAPSFLAVLRGPHHVVELANEAYYQLVGKRDLVGRPLRDALPEAVEQGFVTILDQVLATGEPFVGREVPVILVREPGAPEELRFLDFVYQPLVEADGTRSGVVAHGSDVTEQVVARREVERLLSESERARAEAEAARAAAEAANRAKDEFLALVSHELRSPLAGIASNAQMMAMGICGPVSERQRQALERIRISEEHLLQLVEQLLDLKRISAGHMLYDVAPVDVDEVLAVSAELMDSQLEQMGLRFHRPESASGLAVHADADRLRQILVNLLSNAAKFTVRGGAVTVGCEAAAAADDAGGGERVRIHVRDTGIGIPPDKLEAIFEPFVQVRDRRRPVVVGTGLGLAISRDLARGMGGDLTVESTPGVGSTFTLWLPRAPEGIPDGGAG